MVIAASARPPETSSRGTAPFSRSASHPVVAAHLSASGRAVVLCDGELQLRRGSAVEVLFETADLPGGCPHTPGCRAHLAAVAAAWALGFDREQIRAAVLHPVTV